MLGSTRTKTKVGYEIPFTRHFYKYKALRALTAIEGEIRALEDRDPRDVGRGASVKSTGIAWIPWKWVDDWETYKVAHGFSAVGSGTTPDTGNARLLRRRRALGDDERAARDCYHRHHEEGNETGSPRTFGAQAVSAGHAADRDVRGDHRSPRSVGHLSVYEPGVLRPG